MKAIRCVLWENCSVGAVTSLGFLCGFFREQLSYSSFLFPLVVDWRVAEFPKLCWDGFEVFDLAAEFWERCQVWQLFVLWDVPNVPLGADSVRIPWEESSVQLCVRFWASFIISFTSLKLWFHTRSAGDPWKGSDGMDNAKMPFLFPLRNCLRYGFFFEMRHPDTLSSCIYWDRGICLLSFNVSLWV